jgi:predicted NBD/HSP70 family sugar kinase
VYVENGVKLSAMGYFSTHLDEKQDNLVYLYVGNGIGSGIILNRQLYRGSGNFSGEIGFMAEPSIMKDQNYAVNGGYMESLMGPLVDYGTGELKQKGNPGRRKKLAAILGAIAVNHAALVNPDVIVLAGKIFDKTIIDEINRYMAHYLPAQAIPRITLDENGATGLEGLINSCRGFITTGIHLVERTGLPQQTARMAV